MAAQRDLRVNITADTSDFDRAMSEALAKVARFERVQRRLTTAMATAVLFETRANGRHRFDPRRVIDRWHAAACCALARRSA